MVRFLIRQSGSWSSEAGFDAVIAQARATFRRSALSEAIISPTIRSAQEYSAPLFVLSGMEYASVPFSALPARLCDALRGDRLRLVAEVMQPDGRLELIFENDSIADTITRFEE